MFIKILPVSNPPGRLAEVELHFTDGPLVGLKLAGFAIWERRSRGDSNVTFPARSYSVNGERRTFALLRPDTGSTDALRTAILDAYAEHEQDVTGPASPFACMRDDDTEVSRG